MTQFAPKVQGARLTQSAIRNDLQRPDQARHPQAEMNRRSSLVLCCASVVAASLLLDLNHFHRQQTADSLMPVLNSLLHWTPFFWGQRYYGMLWPYLTRPIHDFMWNFWVNNALAFAGGVGVHFAVAAYLFRSPLAHAIGACSVALLLGLTSHHWSFVLLGPALFFATPMVLGLGALWAVEVPPRGGKAAPRYLLAAGLVALACWFNVSSPLILAVLAAARQPWGRRFDRPLACRQGLVLGFGLAVGYGLMQQVELPGPQLALVPLAEWPGALNTMARENWQVIQEDFAPQLGGLPGYFIALGLLASGALAGLWRGGAAAAPLRKNLPMVGKLAALCLTFMVFVAVQQWAKLNGYSGRYWFPAIVALQVSAVALALLPFEAAAPRLRRRLDGLAALLLCAACIGRYGLPSPSGVRADLDAWAGSYTEQILASRANFVGGSYWTVWPAVFHANLTLQRTGNPAGRQIFGMANKGAQLLSSVPAAEWTRARIFVPRSERSTFAHLARLGNAPLHLLQRTDGFDLVGLSPARPRRPDEAGSAP